MRRHLVLVIAVLLTSTAVGVAQSSSTTRR